MQVEIAAVLKVDKGTISREISKRKRKNGLYEATTAQQKADQKRRLAKYQGMKVEQNADLKSYIVSQLESGQSPDAISGRMKQEQKTFFASKNAIYAWLYSVWGQRYCPLLCTKQYRPRTQKGGVPKRQMISNRISFRDCIVPIRSEADQAVSSKNTAAIAVAVIRESKLLVATKVPNHTPLAMKCAMRRLNRRADLGQTIADNGIENKHHEDWGMPVCFADPHAPWQKPLVEQSIGLLRRWFFPKKTTDWNVVSASQLSAAIFLLNRKYRKSLGYRSAYEVASACAKIKKITPCGVAFEGGI
jgi:IS30 family transposase